MADSADPYWKLRPPPPTPDDELCGCADSPIVLAAHHSSNPLLCMVCNLEVPPERIGFSEALSERLAFWQSFHDCFYLLWLDSGEYESWAKAQLENPTSPVNQRGLELVSELGEFRPAYYWWFQDTAAEGFQPLNCCPVCGGELAMRHKQLVCASCSVMVAN